MGVNTSKHSQLPKLIRCRLTKSKIRYLKKLLFTVKKKRSKEIKMGEENGYSWFCWRRSSPAYSAAPNKEQELELNPSPLQRASIEFPSPSRELQELSSLSWWSCPWDRSLYLRLMKITTTTTKSFQMNHPPIFLRHILPPHQPEQRTDYLQ